MGNNIFVLLSLFLVWGLLVMDSTEGKQEVLCRIPQRYMRNCPRDCPKVCARYVKYECKKRKCYCLADRKSCISGRQPPHSSWNFSEEANVEPYTK
ncbi:hypothetical protein ACJIZ3_009088 [Penstemon smallii]|uniref:Uncharacterized protein n=1 Tax=Penstemon smallii TaxID=265156 RepID=A0ABD3TDG0_9LAMI